MHLNSTDANRVAGTVTAIQQPAGPDRPAQHDPAVSARVSEILSAIEWNGLATVLRYARESGAAGGDDLGLRADAGTP